MIKQKGQRKRNRISLIFRKIDSTNKALNWRTISEYRNAENEEGKFALEQSWSADKKMELDSAKRILVSKGVLDQLEKMLANFWNSGIFTYHQEDRGIWKKNRSESFILKAVWELWKEGNSSKLENLISQSAAIIPKITDWLKDCSQLLDIRSSWTFTDSILMDALYIHQAHKLAIDSKIIVDCFNKNKEAPKITHT
ncbi:hypothetical protein FXO38_06337 [Capsicum annuum]|nr:hypothetical protein FXO38_06337 [Capsicum annuum]